MRPRLSWRRRLARALLDRGAVFYPEHRSSWASAMRAEAEYIDDDREALNWAVGSCRAGAVERLQWLGSRFLPSTHSLGLVWIGMFIVSSAFNLSIMLATRLHFDGTASMMGRLIDGYRYDRFVRLADALPVGVLALMGAAVALFVLCLFLSLRKRPIAYTAFCGAAAFSLAVWLVQLAIPAYSDAMSLSHRWRIGICFAMTAAILMMLKSGKPSPQLTTRRVGESQQ